MIHNILLAFSFARRDFNERYVGTGLGQIWYILYPIVTIFIYTVVFSDFMKMKLNIIDNSYAYSIYLIPGLLAWTSFSTIISRLSTSFFEKSHLIKKINVPMYTFQLSIVLTEFFVFFISIFFSLVFLLLVNQPINWTLSIFFITMILQTLFAFGIGVIFSLFTVFFRDLKEAIPIVLQLWFWLTPIIYLKSMIADKYPSLLKYNPFYYFAEIYQNIFLYSKLPSVDNFFIIFSLTIVSILLAAWFYKKMIATIKDIV